MNPYLKYGVPATVGIGTSAMAAQEEEDIGSVGLAGATGALGGAAGLLGARALAGKYAPQIMKVSNLGVDKAKAYLGDPDGPVRVPRREDGTPRIGARIRPRYLRKQAKNIVENLDGSGYDPNREINPQLARYLGGATALATVPAAGLAAGLGGVAAGEIPGAFGIPGFVDPEAYGSSNSPGARYKQSTVNYM